MNRLKGQYQGLASQHEDKTMDKEDIETKMERLAKTTRERMLRIWDGDAERADECICQIMRYFKDRSGELPPEISERVMRRLAQLIQR
jgi:hypothetical protein